MSSWWPARKSGDRLGAALIAAIKRRSRARAIFRRRRRADGRPRRAKPVSARRSGDHRLCRHPGEPAENLAPHSRNRRRRHRRQAGRPGHHRQPGIHPPRGATRARARAEIPIVDYVWPSVWAWRPGRARAMSAYVDHVLALLPFEPAVLQRLGGPPCSYVGHPLIEQVVRAAPERRGGAPAARRSAAAAGAAGQPRGRDPPHGGRVRRGGGAAAERIGAIEVVVPAVPRLADTVRAAVASWPRAGARGDRAARKGRRLPRRGRR